MALGYNIAFPIYVDIDGVKTPFHDLTLRKATVDSVVMSLGGKITGNIVYADNSLVFSMREYIEYNDTKYYIVNPPTVTREGTVSENSGLNGVTKYSLEFYHPEYWLSDYPFADVAVRSGEERYLSQNKTFSWIGTLEDYVDKLNENLDGTEWKVVISSTVDQEVKGMLSDVLQFDDNTIADALKTLYDTWKTPFTTAQLSVEEHGKKYVVTVGLPSNEIYENVDDEEEDQPFVFMFGRGVGLKNNSRTSKNNKIITRIAPYGSENNIPYGYPQIVWYGNQDWDYTIKNNPNEPNSYPIYKGIVGGQFVKLIKHPFTRIHLMPSIYSQTVFNKVSPYLSNGQANPSYNHAIEIKDYYDAVATQEYPYVNEINLQAPSYESHEFAEIKPELDSDRQLGIVSAIPLNQDLTPASQWDDTYDAEKDEYVQSYFRITLPQLDFDLYACAAITQEMQINMRSGACIGCTFPVQVDWEDYKRNFYDEDGNFAPDGQQRDLTKYPKSNLGQINVVVQKDLNTFGTLMPNIYKLPTEGDNFVILGISLPLSYIENAEIKLDVVAKEYMLENNIYYYEYPLKFDEYFLATHTNILSQIRPNSVIRFQYANEELKLYVKQITVKYGESPLPKYDITLTDNIEVVLNQIGQAASDIQHLGTLFNILNKLTVTQSWIEKNYVSIPFFEKIFGVYNGNTRILTNSAFSSDSGDISIKANFGLYTEKFLSALGLNNSGGGGGATSLDDLVNVEIASPTDGQVLKYNELTHKWVNGDDEGVTSVLWSNILNKPTTIGGYGITDAYISNGVIHLGGVEITPLTSFTETDPTVPSWAKEAQKPSYAFSEITGTATTAQIPSLDANKITSGTFDVNRIPNLTVSKITDFPSKWAWSDIDNKPTTLSGYGITDVTIADGVITLGTGNTITPVTSVAMTVPTGFVVTGSPITKTGTLALAYSAGYEGFTTTLKNKIDLLYSLFTREGSGTSADPYIIKANYGLYTEQFLSALGLNSQQGSSGALYSLLDVKPDDPANPSKVYGAQTGYVLTYGSDGKWYAAQATGSVTSIIVGTTTYSPVNGVITLPAYPQVPSWALQPNKPSYAFSEITGSATASQVPNIEDLDNFSTKVYDASATRTANTILAAPNGSNGHALFRQLVEADIPSLAASKITSGTFDAARIPDLSTTYAAVGRVSTLEGYFTNGVANNAERLSTVSKTAWGQTYWTANGVPDSISGDMSGVGNITMNGETRINPNGNALYIGNSNNASWVYLADMASQSGASYWNIYANGAALFSTVKANKFYLYKPNNDDTDAVYFEYESLNGGVHLVGAGFYSDSFISALGLNSQGGGGASALYDLTDVKPDDDTTPTKVYGLTGGSSDDGKILTYSSTYGKWYAGSTLAWSNITGRPTALSQFTNDVGYITSSALSGYATQSWAQINCIPRLAWWYDTDTHDVDTLVSGTTFAYTNHNAPVSGTIVAFSSTRDSYQLQLQGGYAYNKLYFRNKQGDLGTWNAWREIIHSGNISSQSVSYATTAGSAPASDVYAWAKAATKPSYAFREITGTAATSQIPSLDASKITSGALDTNRIPDLSGTYVARTGSMMSGDLSFGSGNGISMSYTYGDPEDPESDVLEIVDGVISVGHGGDITISGNSVWHAGNFHPSDYLPLSAGSTKALTGDLYLGSHSLYGVVDATLSGNLSVVNITASGYVQTSSYIKIGNVYLTYDQPNNAIRVSANANGTGAANFYALGGVSALGYSASGGGGGGASSLSDLTDVQITNVASGQILRYDGTHWINVTPNYATTTQLANYLPLSGGGTITGNNIQMNVSSSGLSWKIGNTSYGSIVFSMGNSGPVINLSSITKYNGYDIRNSNDTYFGTATSDSIPITIGGTTHGVAPSVVNGYVTRSGDNTITGTLNTSNDIVLTAQNKGIVFYVNDNEESSIKRDIDNDLMIDAARNLYLNSGGSGYAIYLNGNEAATQSWVSQQGYITLASVKGNFSAWDNSPMPWGTLTYDNGYTIGVHAASPDGGDWGMVYKNGQIFMQLDGYYYQQEGAYRVLDTSDIGLIVASQVALANYLPLSGGTLTSTTSASPLTLQGNSTANSLLAFADSAGNTIGYLGMGVGVAGNYPIYNNGSTSYKIWHSGNLTPSNYATTSQLNDYLLRSGGTMAGTLTMSDDLIISGNNDIIFDVDSTIYADSYGTNDFRLYINGYGGVRISVAQGSTYLDISDSGIETNKGLTINMPSVTYTTPMLTLSNQDVDVGLSGDSNGLYINTGLTTAGDVYVGGNILLDSGIIDFANDNIIHYGHYGSGSTRIYIDGYDGVVLVSNRSGQTVDAYLDVSYNGVETNKSIGLAQTAGSGAGISLYGGSGNVTTYGIMFATTSNFGTLGSVTGDWATYFTMDSTNSRGWIFRRGTTNVCSIGNDYGSIYTRGHVKAENGIFAVHSSGHYGSMSNNGSETVFESDNGNNIKTNIEYYASDVIFSTIDGSVYGDFVQQSDIRLKNVWAYDVEPSFEAVVNAPTIRYTWNELSKSKNRDMHLGSVAQYWHSILPEAIVSDKDGYLAMNYDVIALLSAISVAKRVTEHERRIEHLERENALLRMEINELKEAA